MDESVERRIPLPFLLTPIIALITITTIAGMIGPKLIVEHPLLMMALDSRNRWLILASPQVDTVPYYVVGFLRLVASDPLTFLIGRQYGEAALGWAGDKMGDDGRQLDRMRRWFNRAAPVFIFIAPSLIWCILAGVTRMRVWVFLTMNISGTIARLVLLRLLGATFEEEVNSVLDFFRSNMKWILVVTIGFGLVQVIRQRRSKEIATPAEIQAEIEAEEEALGTRRPDRSADQQP